MAPFHYGTVLKIQREHSDGDIVRYLTDIRDCGLNCVVVWPAVFWWEDRTAPDYPFRTGRMILAEAERLGLSVVMELAGQITSLEYVPDFVMRDEYLAVNRDGTYRRVAKPYDYINFNHPDVARLIRKNFLAAATAYKEFPALYGYDIWNETMFTSFDQFTLRKFQDWLERKYGAIERLNAVWDRTYFDWSQITFTEWTWASVMPVVDYEQFHKANVGMLLADWRAAVREADPTRPCIADNILSGVTVDGFYERPQDDWNVAENVDEYGVSFYPKNRLPQMPDSRRWATFSASRAASRKGKFWVSELQSHHQCLFNPFSVVEPYDQEWWNWEAVSQGAKGIVYWKWHPFIKGIQTYGRGLVDLNGKSTPRAERARRIAGILASEEEAFVSWPPEQARAAILYDDLNHDFVKAYTRYYEPFVESSLYVDSLGGLYDALWRSNTAADFVKPDQVASLDPDQYKVLFVTTQLNVGDALADALRKYAEGGGVVVIDGKTGYVDDDGLLLDAVPGGKLNPALGVSFVDVSPGGLLIKSADGSDLPGYYERAVLRTTRADAAVEAVFEDGSPAIVTVPCGKGFFTTAASYLWYGYHKNADPRTAAYLQSLSVREGLCRHPVSDVRIHTACLRDGDDRLLFAFNYAAESVGGTIELQVAGPGRFAVKDLSSGKTEAIVAADGAFQLKTDLPPRSVGIFKIARMGT
jgi:hypothetical protein